MGSRGLEPPTSRLSGVRSNHLSYEPVSGGDKRVRTADPLLAKQVLSQLSYTPVVPPLGLPLLFENQPQKLNNDSNLGLTAFAAPTLDFEMLFTSLLSIERR